MKLLLFISLFSFQLQASDLIYKSGFESTALVSGNLSGLNGTDIKLQLTVNNISEIITINTNGQFLFSIEVTIGSSWSVIINSLPNTPQQQSCLVTNNTGVMQTGGADSLQVVCNNQLWNWNQFNWDEGGWN